MKRLLITLVAAVSVNLYAVETAAIRDMIGRVTAGHQDKFSLELISKEKGQDVFEAESRDGKIVLRGSGGVALASAWKYCLNSCCNANS